MFLPKPHSTFGLLFLMLALAVAPARASTAALATTAVQSNTFGGPVVTHVQGPEDAPLVVLLHGLSHGASDDWQPVVPALVDDYRVITLDLPGFGASLRGNHRYAPDEMARAVREAVRHHDPRPFRLVGHSMGGAIALAYAHQFPDDLHKLVLVNLAGVLHHSVVAQGLSRLGVEGFSGGDAQRAQWLAQLTEVVLAEVDRLGISPAMLVATPWLRQVALGGEAMAISALAMAAHDFGPALREVRTPTEIIWGRDDTITPLRTGQLAAAVMPKARLMVLDDAGHMPMFEVPDAFNGALRIALGNASTPPPPLLRRAPTATRVTHCLDEAGKTFTGELGHLDLTRCTDVVIENANLRSLRIDGGNVRLINSHVHEGIEARQATLEITAGSVTGDPALVLDRVTADVAGTRFLLLGSQLVRNDGTTPLALRLSVASRQGFGGDEQLLHQLQRVDQQW